MIDADTPAYFASDTALAAGIDVLTLQNWLKRGAFGFTPHDRVGKGAGSRHLFTFRSVFILAVTAEMVRNGITPQHAYSVARSCLIKRDISPEYQPYILVYPGGLGFAVAARDEWFTPEKIFDDPELGDFASFLIIDPAKLKQTISQRLKHEGESK